MQPPPAERTTIGARPAASSLSSSTQLDETARVDRDRAELGTLARWPTPAARSRRDDSGASRSAFSAISPSRIGSPSSAES